MGTNGKLLKLSFEILILPFCERLSSTSMFEIESNSSNLFLSKTLSISVFYRLL